MKKLLVVASFGESLVNFRGQLLEAFLDAGLEVHAAAPDLDQGNPFREILESKGINVHTIPMQRTGMNPIADLKALTSLRSLMQRIKPDVFLGYTVKPVVYGTLAARLAGVPVRFALITGLGYAFTGEASGKRAVVQKIVRGLYRAALSQATKVFFQNPDDELLFRQTGILPVRVPSMVISGSGIDTRHFASTTLPKGAPRFLLIARLLGDKGIREYAEAARIVKSNHPSAHFALVGWADDNPEAIAKSELDDWVAEGTIQFLGKLDDVRTAITDASVYVLPSYREGTPRTVLEAMAMGRPIITTDAPGCRETVKDGENGYLVPVRSVDALASAMEKFILDPRLVTQMGECSRALAESKYDVHKVNASMLQAMELA